MLTRPRWLLHLEGLALLAASVWLYAHTGDSWLLFAVLLLAPDLSALGYLINVRVGAGVYNLVHTDAIPVVLALVAFSQGQRLALALALIWLAHIGIDRLAGFGLKYPTKFQDTHLQHV
jgi:hypothetical protein